MSNAGAYAGSATESLKSNAQSLREKNYHGQLAQGIGSAMQNAQSKAYNTYENYNHQNAQNNSNKYDDDYYQEEEDGEFSGAVSR